MPEICAPAEAAQLRAEQKVGACRIDFTLAGRDTIEVGAVSRQRMHACMHAAYCAAPGVSGKGPCRTQVKNFPGAVLRDMPQLSGSRAAAADATEEDAEQDRPKAPPTKVLFAATACMSAACCALGH
jgi:hypothetical protein